MIKISGQISSEDKFMLSNVGEMYTYTISKECIITFDEIQKIEWFSNRYEQPQYDNRYGENKDRGPLAFIKTNSCEAIISYGYEFTKSTDYIKILESLIVPTVSDNNIKYECSGEIDISIILSKEGLFSSKEKMDEIVNIYFNNIKSNSVSCSFWFSKVGMLSKLPYSIEPFNKEAYGVSIHHSSQRHLLPYIDENFAQIVLKYNHTRIVERHPFKDNMFLTMITSTWLKNLCGIEAPYFDTRLNETFYLTLHECNSNLLDDYEQNYFKFLMARRNLGQVYGDLNSFLFPDYFGENELLMSHFSLNHQIGIILYFIRIEEFIYAKKMINYINYNAQKFIKDNNDLYYGYSHEKGYFGDDYIYVTLIDLLNLCEQYMKNFAAFGHDVSLFPSNSILQLIKSKLKYLDDNNYGILDIERNLPLGENFDTYNKVLKKLMNLQLTSFCKRYEMYPSIKPIISIKEKIRLELLNELLKCGIYLLENKAVIYTPIYLQSFKFRIFVNNILVSTALEVEISPNDKFKVEIYIDKTIVEVMGRYEV